MNEQWEKFLNRASDWLIAYGPRILVSIILLVLGLWLIRIINKWVRNAMIRRRFDPSLRPFLQNLFHSFLVLLLVLALMQVLGIQMTIFAAMIAALTVAAGLALSGTLQNFASGVLILVQRPYRVGDNIITQGSEGTVSSIRLFYTVVLTHDNKTIYIPNGQLFNNVVVNLSREGKRRLDIELKFAYTHDLDTLKQSVEKVIANADYLLTDPPHRIGIIGLEADKFILSINVWTPAHGILDMRMKLQESIIRQLQQDGIYKKDPE